MKKNQPALWDAIWQNTTLDRIQPQLATEENSIRWARIEKAILDRFGSFEGLRVIELGAGVGTCSALMARKGAKITVLDYSETALRVSQELFRALGFAAEFVQCNALNLPSHLLHSFDISMSFGLTEHFIGQKRIAINKAHFDVLRGGGIAIISVPNRYNPPYRLWKWILQSRNKWIYGEEYPYSRKELREICRQVGVTDYFFAADSLISSFKFLNIINPLRLARKFLSGGKPLGKNPASARVKEKGTFLDQYFSYALVLCAIKPGDLCDGVNE